MYHLPQLQSDKNGKNKIMEKELLKKEKDESIVNLEEHSKQMTKEDSSGEELKNLVSSKQGKCTYAEMLLKGTEKGEKKLNFKV